MVGCARGSASFPSLHETQEILHNYEDSTNSQAKIDDLECKFRGVQSMEAFKRPSAYIGITQSLRIWQSTLLDEIDEIFLKHFDAGEDIGCVTSAYCDALDGYCDEVVELILEKSKAAHSDDDSALLDRLAAAVAYYLTRRDQETPLPLMTKSMILRCHILLERSPNAILEVSHLLDQL